jgi:hypothetical protein
LLLFCCGAPHSVHAQAQVLHEYVPDVQPGEAALLLGEATGQGAIVYDGEVLSAPDAQASAADSPPFVATLGDGRQAEVPGQRAASFRPDRLTQLEGELDYYEAFNPSIAPFKRVTSLDAIVLDADGKTAVLVVGHPGRHDVPIESADTAPPDARPRDRFFGDVTLDFRASREVPLPSVSPESRILRVSTVPQVALRIERDGADNFFARLQGQPPPGLVHMTFLTDAPRAYFGAELPAVPVRVLAREVAPLPPSVARRALAFAAEIGADDAGDLRSTLAALTRYFREFNESSVPPQDTGDAYLDLVRGKKGVCRHRAYGFVITAQALGIPARFVQNEAHSWVEVKVPALGFLRIDLGGAAHGLTAHGAADKPVYTPASPDTLPRPESYRASYSTLDHGVTGLRPSVESVVGRWVGPAGSAVDQGAALFLAGSRMGGPADARGRKALTLQLKDGNATVLRGGKLVVTGRLMAGDGKGIAELRVEISIASALRKERMLLGVTVSDEDGYFRASLGVPLDLDVGDYRLVVLSPGSSEYLPVVAE